MSVYRGVWGWGTERHAGEFPNKKSWPYCQLHNTPSAMAQVFWCICLFIFIRSPWSATSDHVGDEPLMTNSQRTESSPHNFILQNGAPRSGLSAPPLPGGNNIITEINEDDEDDEMQDGPKVTLRQGEALGSVRLSRWTRRPIYQFLGIPYAKPPVGDLRFMVSQNLINWKDFVLPRIAVFLIH